MTKALEKVWKMLPTAPEEFADSIGYPPFEAQLLYNRGLRSADCARAFFQTGDELSHDPFLLPDMDKAVARLRSAAFGGDVIGVFGDFDTDGVSGAAVVVTALESLGMKVVPYLPHRVEEGHGLTLKAVDYLESKGVTLLITVDNGVSSGVELAHAAVRGIETIVTDHHALPPDPPSPSDVVAVVNPRRDDHEYPTRNLTGAGLAYKLMEGLWASLGKPRPEHLLEFAALGTVSDVAPLFGENRYIVKRGLEFLASTGNPGLRALMNRSGPARNEMNTEYLSFTIIPRLNAPGRIDHARHSLDLLTTSDDAEARAIADRLETANDERKTLAADGLEQAVEQIHDAHDGALPPLLFVESETWHRGILGLIAGSLCEQFYRPAVVVRRGGYESWASARSIPEFDITDAITSTSPCLPRHGGHSEAGGFTVSTEDLPVMRRELVARAAQQLGDLDLVPAIEIDAEASPSSLLGERFEFMRKLGPFGKANPDPVLLARGARVVDARRVGPQRDHWKMRIAHEGKTWPAVAFRQGKKQVNVGDMLDVVYTFGLNTWNGQTECQLTVADMRPSAPH